MLPGVHYLSQSANPERLRQRVRWKYQGETVTFRSTQDLEEPHTYRAQHNYLQITDYFGQLQLYVKRAPNEEAPTLEKAGPC